MQAPDELRMFGTDPMCCQSSWGAGEQDSKEMGLGLNLRSDLNRKKKRKNLSESISEHSQRGFVT